MSNKTTATAAHGAVNQSTTLDFLTALGYGPGDTVNFTAFLPAGEARERKDSGRKCSAPYPEIPHYLLQWEEEGRGIYAVINKGGTTRAAITSCVAIFYEHDDLPTDESAGLWESLGLPAPTMWVYTGNKSVHSYWVLSQPITPDQWRSLQTDLLNFAKADRSLKNENRVMRLPGFKHPKTGEVATLVPCSGERYHYADLRRIVPFPPTEDQRPPALDFSNSTVIGTDESRKLEWDRQQAREMLSHIPKRTPGNGQYEEKDWVVFCALIDRFGEGEGLALCREWSPDSDWGEDLDRKARSLRGTSKPIKFGSLVELAKGYGWAPRPKREPRAKTSPKRTPAKQQPPATEETATEPHVGERPKLAVLWDIVSQHWAGRIRYNLLTNMVEMDGSPVEDVGSLRLQLALEGIRVGGADVELIVARMAQEAQYHPVMDYLERVGAEHGTDTSILDGFALKYFGQSQEIYTTYCRRWLVGAVARIFEPGCKLDTVLILQGAQGAGKSTFFRTLTQDDWFDDSMGSAARDVDERLKLHQFWVLEWAELEAVFKKKDVAEAKNFISCQMDTVRKPYGRNAVQLRRRSVLVGSTNDDGFLSDPSGSRRFWVLPVAQRVPLELLRLERDRIWAAALALYRQGERWWLTEEEDEHRDRLNKDWQSTDPWEPVIARHCAQVGIVPTTEGCLQMLGIELGRQTRQDSIRVAKILRDLGYQRVRERDTEGARRYVWRK